MNMNKLIPVMLACCSVGTALAGDTIPKFKTGERVVFVGDSITHGGRYHSYIWLYYMTRYPTMPITVMNAGIGGDCAWDIQERMDEDVLCKNPTYMTMTFGMNDSGYYDFFKEDAQEIAARQIQRSFDCYQDIEQKMKAAKGVTKVMLGGSPYDETAKIENNVFPTKDAALQKIIDFQVESAQKNGWGFVDFHQPMRDISLREQQNDPAFALCGGDRIHPDNDGHMVMAYLFLKAQGLAGEKVADIAIDAKTVKVETAANCSIKNLKKTANGVSFSYLARALPYPVDTFTRGWGSKKPQADGLKLVPFIDEFNQERLSVKHLPDGNYQLKIDGAIITTVTAAALQEGINLAELTNTPQYQQALQVMLLNEERFGIEQHLRDYAWMEFSFLQGKGLLFADNQEAMDAIQAELEKNAFISGNYENYFKARFPSVRQAWQDQMDLLVDTIYEINQPVNHQIELVKVD
ncbi:MAG: SGNH/GDSL hydrolase family protein [Pontiellaceae bacterium]|nr:SGNH/GDSL hydrolase family protein [Pontiellaceae bacterium]MBN2783667.1 SGNH/GDSL hydrolase family protein [Pontiellaceae bacterium]